MGNLFYPLDENDKYQDTIVSFPHPDSPNSTDRPMFKLGQITSGIHSHFSSIYIQKSSGACVSISKDKWQKCEIIQPGKHWQTGKIRLRVVIEFCPDEPESDRDLDSPLDDIRQMSDNS